MYAWIWRQLPFGLPGKITGSVLLVGGLAALLWFVVFPWADPWIERQLLPWDESQLVGDLDPAPGTGPEPSLPAGDPSQDPAIGPSEVPTPTDPHAIPYETDD